MDEKTQETLVNKITEKAKAIFGEKKPPDGGPANASFSEADVKKLVEDSIKTATASFPEEIKPRDTKIAELTSRVEKQASSASHAEIVSFVESIGKDSFPPLRVFLTTSFTVGYCFSFGCGTDS